MHFDSRNRKYILFSSKEGNISLYSKEGRGNSVVLTIKSKDYSWPSWDCGTIYKHCHKFFKGTIPILWKALGFFSLLYCFESSYSTEEQTLDSDVYRWKNGTDLLWQLQGIKQVRRQNDLRHTTKCKALASSDT